MKHSKVRRGSRRSWSAMITCALALPLTISAGAPANAGVDARAADPVANPIRLSMPKSGVAYNYGQGIYTDLGAGLTANGEAFELRAKRTDWNQPITVTWQRSSGAVTLPAGTLEQFQNGLQDFYKVTLYGGKGRFKESVSLPLCPTSSQRANPDAAAHNPYPDGGGCFLNPFTIGSVVGVQKGWVAKTQMYFMKPHKVGKYYITTEITPKYQKLFGVDSAHASARTELRITKDESFAGNRSADPTNPSDRRSARPDGAAGATLKPAARRPSGPAMSKAAADDLPKPDLQALPATGMAISPSGNYLQFSATVWNGGTSPLVVDGFRRDSEDVMDAYQYFFDRDENQVGYQSVGSMEWDARPSHSHWHFRDFAKYELLNADKTVARLSAKEAFCLANTDAIDYTLPNADWHPDGTDLSTACGDLSSTSVREALAVGSGDTYSQIRAGQSFNLKGLPNGKYYIAVTANPDHNLIETSTANNVSYREVTIGGRNGARTVKVGKVGLVDDSDWFQNW